LNNNYADSPLDLIEGRLFFERKGKSEYDGIKNVEFRRNNARYRPETKKYFPNKIKEVFEPTLFLFVFTEKIRCDLFKL